MYSKFAEKQDVTEKEYLAAEALSDEKHEYLNGLVYPLHYDPISNRAGAGDAHVKITGNAHYQGKRTCAVQAVVSTCRICALRLMRTTKPISTQM